MIAHFRMESFRRLATVSHHCIFLACASLSSLSVSHVTLACTLLSSLSVSSYSLACARHSSLSRLHAPTLTSLRRSYDCLPFLSLALVSHHFLSLIFSRLRSLIFFSSSGVFTSPLRLSILSGARMTVSQSSSLRSSRKNHKRFRFI